MHHQPIAVQLDRFSTENTSEVHRIATEVQQRNRYSTSPRALFPLMRQSLCSELSGTIAHELNQPLTAILLNAETAQDGRAGEVIGRVSKLVRKGESKP